VRRVLLFFVFFCTLALQVGLSTRTNLKEFEYSSTYNKIEIGVNSCVAILRFREHQKAQRRFAQKNKETRSRPGGPSKAYIMPPPVDPTAK
jgi:hypothetical protein